MTKKIACFVAGHSGGHILPSLTRAQQFLDEERADEILFFSTASPLDTKIISTCTFISKHVGLNVGTLPYTKKWLIPFFIFRLGIAFCISLYHLIRMRPSVIISMGGYVSVPVCLAGWLLRIPLEVYELNIEPGKAVTFLSRFAQKLWILYPETALYLPEEKCHITTYPLRFSEHDRSITQEQARSSLHLDHERTTLFILGGSQGSVFLNTLIKEWIIQHSPELHGHIQIIHQTGSWDSTNWQSFYNQCGIPAFIFEYHENIALCYQASDLVISRAGAGTLAELAFFKKKSLVIPLETATTRHQKYNAQACARINRDLFCVLPQHGIEHAVFFSTLDRLLAIQ